MSARTQWSLSQMHSDQLHVNCHANKWNMAFSISIRVKTPRIKKFQQRNEISICFTVTIFFFEGVYGCFMTWIVILAGNSEVSLELQCLTAELITYIMCECDAPESFRGIALTHYVWYKSRKVRSGCLEKCTLGWSQEYSDLLEGKSEYPRDHRG